MKEHRMEGSPRRVDSLWMLVAAPTIWLAHFLLSYITAAVWCAKLAEGASLGGARTAVAMYSAAAIAGIGAVGQYGWRRHCQETRHPHDVSTGHGRQRFLGFAILLLAGLSAVAVIYGSLPAVFIASCD
jgi:membrane protein YdbS with pleckstrin-like domain